ncbi:MAG: YIP1 family protein [Gammaproteobacteria bacterium]|nr:YIP1 family protein [Gammaproteobacteria bacterium]MDH5628691.1 YIP1 family protein [Gammaproteobacteria bacterium]
MSLMNAVSLLYNPAEEWKKIGAKNPGILNTYLGYLIFFAAIPPVSAFIGSTYVGWTIGDGETHKLTVESAMKLSIIAYFAILAAVLVLSAFVQWMAKTYGAKPSLSDCVNLTAYSCSPLFLVGLLGVFPILWLNMLTSIVAIAMAVNLLYKGVPTLMNINEEKGFLFASSILTVCMVVLVGMLAITIIFWGSGFSPIFIS